MADSSYASVFPIPVDAYERSWSESELLVQINESIRIEDVSDLIQKTPFEFWTEWSHEHGERECKRLRNTRYALVRRFECATSEDVAEKEISKNLLYRLYLSLKVIRASKERFVALHYLVGKGNPTVRGSWRNEFDSELLDCEFEFPIRPEDLRELANVARQSLAIFANRTLSVTQAAYSLEIGYRAEFVNVKHLIWVVGLDALFSTDKNTTSAVVKKRISDFLGEDFVMYPDQREIDLPRLIGLSLNDALEEIYKLRNHFAHGTWPDSRWAGKVCRPRALGTGDINYSGMLLEAAVAILRACLRKILNDNELMDMFNNKAKMHAHFAARGIA
jgi:hypothetical protein